jgi:amidase
LARSLDTIGPLGATVGRVVDGMTLLEPGFAVADTPAIRIGRVRLGAETWVDDALDEALGASGMDTVDLALPGWEDATIAAMVVLGSEAWAEHCELWKANAADLSPDVAARLEASSTISAEEVAAGWETARDWVAELTGAFRQVEILALPTLAESPPNLANASRLTEIRYVSPFNLSGMPALAMPVPGGDAVPPSLQLVGPAGSEALILATAAVIEEAAGRPHQVTGGR